MHFLRFLFSKYFYLNIFIALVFTAGLIFGAVKWMDNYTANGYSKALPDFKGTHIDKLEQRFSEEKLRFVILYTITSDQYPKGVVVDQTPKAFSLVKDNRTVYLTVNSMENEKVRMPNLKDSGTKIALKKLKALGLELDSIWNVPGSLDGLIIDQLFDGESVAQGTLLNKGSKVVIKVSRRNIHSEKVILLDFSGLSLKDAEDKAKLSSLYLNPICSDCVDKQDTLNSTISSQYPEYKEGKKVRSGSQIDVFLELKQE